MRLDRLLSGLMAAAVLLAGAAFALTWATSESQSDNGAQNTLATTLVYELAGLSTDISVSGEYKDNQGDYATTYVKVYDDETGTLLAQNSTSIGSASAYATITAANHALSNAVRRIRVVASSTYSVSDITMRNVNVLYSYENDAADNLFWNTTMQQEEGGTQGTLGSSLTFVLPNACENTTALVVRGNYRDSWQASGAKSKVRVYNDEDNALLMDSGWVRINNYDSTSNPRAVAEPIILSNYALANSVKRVRVEMASDTSNAYVDLFNVSVDYSRCDSDINFTTSRTTAQTLGGYEPLNTTLTLPINASAIIVRGEYRDSWQQNGAKSRINVYDADTMALLATSGWRQINGYDDSSNPYLYAEPIVLSDYSLQNPVSRIVVEMESDAQPVSGSAYVDMYNVTVEYSDSPYPSVSYSTGSGSGSTNPTSQSVSQDIDSDGNLETATDSNSDSTDGYETFSDADGSSVVIYTIDGDSDGKKDFLLDTNSDGIADKYWDPDAGFVVSITVSDANSDGTNDYIFDSNGDGTADKFYDSTSGSVSNYTSSTGTPDTDSTSSGSGGAGGSSGSGGGGGSGGASGAGTGIDSYKGLSIEVAPAQLEIASGKNAILFITIKNKGTISLSEIKFTVEGIPATWYSALPEITLSAGESKSIEWKVNVPEDAELKVYNSKISAKSKQGASALTTFVLHVAGKAEEPSSKSESTTAVEGPTGSALLIQNIALSATLAAILGIIVYAYREVLFRGLRMIIQHFRKMW